MSVQYQFISGIFLLCFALRGAEGVMKLQKEEQEAVYSVLSSVYGEWWNWADEYPDPCNSTPIHGVECTRIGNAWHVIALRINGLDPRSPPCSCDAAIHPSIFSLRYLHVLVFLNCFSVSANKPYAFPSHGWKNLSHLTALNFVNNPSLTGNIPKEIGSLSSLQILEIAIACMGGSLPHEVGKLTMLHSFIICHTRVSGPLPQSIAKLRKLKNLKLSNNALSGSLYPLQNLKLLRIMDVSSNRFEGEIPETFGGLSSLMILSVRNNLLSGSLPTTLTRMTSMEVLLVSGNPSLRCDMMGMGLEWENLGRLVILDVSRCDIVGSVAQVMDHLTKVLKVIRWIVLDDHNKMRKCLPLDFASRNFILSGDHVRLCAPHEEL